MNKLQKIEFLKESLVEKNVTFLFGAGASAPYFSSLGNFEKILSNKSISWQGKALIKTIFYDQSIQGNIYLANYLNDKCYCSDKKGLMLSIIDQYSRFIHNSLEYLKVRNSRISPKRINIISTNYDLFIESAIDKILENNPRVFFNDGSNGYGKRVLSSDNFNKTLLYSGIFDNYSNEMPSINLIKCHGSVNWKEYKEKTGRSKIRVQIGDNLLPSINEDLKTTLNEIKINIGNGWFPEVNSYEELIKKMNGYMNDENFIRIINSIGESSQYSLSNLVSKIETLQIVLPTKEKFQTTLIEEHYFNMLRLVSYELEKQQSLLVVFGFSFKDEHIRDVIQRSLNNPNLLVIIFCFIDNDKEEIITEFNFSSSNIPVNIIFIQPNDFFEKEVPIHEFSEDEYDISKYTIIENENKVVIYSKVVSIATINKKDIPVIDFSSFNSILEENITNKYISINVNEYGDNFE